MSGSDFSDFLGQIGGLIAITIIAGVAWIGLTVLIIQRGSERRRRKEQGLEPLPSFFTQLQNWFEGNTQPAPKQETVIYSPPPPQPSMPTPSLDDLTEDLPTPDFDDLTSDLLEFETEAEDDESAYEDADDADDEIEPVAPNPVATTSAAASIASGASTRVDFIPLEAVPDDAVEIMVLWRDVNDGKIIIDLNGEVFADAAQIKGTKYEARFRNVVKELVDIAVGGGLMTASRLDAAPSRSPAPPPRIETPAEKDDEETASAGIATQIEGYLQQRLNIHSEFATRSIHIRPTDGGGVSIEVDDETYDAVSDVRDESIRAFLQQVMEEWSEQH